jgi:anti-sigma factor RsiW
MPSGMKTVHEIWHNDPDPTAERTDPAEDCAAPQLELTAWLDGKLPVPAHRAFELRLATDPALRSRASEMDQTRTLVLHAYEAILNH